MHLSDIGTIFGILAFVITIGALWGRSQKSEKTATLLRDYSAAAQAWQSLADAKTEEIAALQTQLTAALKLQTEMGAKLQILEDMVTGRSAVEQLGNQILGALTELEGKMVRKDEWASFRDEVRDSLVTLGAARG